MIRRLRPFATKAHVPDAGPDAPRGQRSTDPTLRKGAREYLASQLAGGSDANDGSADFARGLAELGISYKTSWYASVTLYGVGGALCAVLYLVDHSLMPPGIFYLGCFALIIAGLALWGALRLANSPDDVQRRLLHARLAAGFLINLTAALILGVKANAFALFPLVLIPSACFMLPTRQALPYILGSVALIFWGLALTHGTAQLAHALISAVAVLSVAVAILAAKRRTRALAVINRHLAFTDPLTGAANVRSLRAHISAQLGRPDGDGSPLALFAIDLDEFKRVNDQFDHSMGDRVLRAVAEALSHELAQDDLLARRGGDEFSVVVRRPARQDLDQLTVRLEQAIASSRAATCPSVSPSGSVAYVRTRPGEELGELMERADDALHHAKLASRQRRRQTDISAPPDPAAAPPHARGAAAHNARVTAAQAEHPRPTAAAARHAVNPAPESLADWRFAALLLGLMSAGLAVVSAGGLARPLTPAEGLAIAAGLCAMAFGSLLAGGRAIPRLWLHVPWICAYGFIALAIALAGRSGTALLDGLVAIAIYGFLTFKARIATAYLLLALLMYFCFAIAGAYTDGLTRALISAGVVAVVAGVLAKLRVVTVRFARTNRELSQVDELTGAANLRGLRDRVGAVVERARAQQLHPLLVAIDLDDFKSVNDLRSHTAGDRVLIAVARAVADSVRADELVARRGGDEFVVIVDDADREYATAIVDRIAGAIVRARTRLCPDLLATASIASVMWQTGQSADDLLHAADMALHGAKQASHTHRQVAATA